jgi:hypothetical protein
MPDGSIGHTEVRIGDSRNHGSRYSGPKSLLDSADVLRGFF